MRQKSSPLVSLLTGGSVGARHLPGPHLFPLLEYLHLSPYLVEVGASGYPISMLIFTNGNLYPSEFTSVLLSLELAGVGLCTGIAHCWITLSTTGFCFLPLQDQPQYSINFRPRPLHRNLCVFHTSAYRQISGTHRSG